MQNRLADLGWHGAWTAGLGTDAQCTGSGAAVLAPSFVSLTTAPGLADGTLVPGRAAAARVHWGIPQGLVCISLYCVDSVGYAGPNLE
eukprot:2826541-Pyramimonas_sp.AAC.1